MNVSVSESSSSPATAQSTAQIPIPAAQQAVLAEAARWVLQRGPKCILSPKPELLRRYDPRPYQCTVRCGKNFDKRADWKRHEEINYPQEGWVCQEMSCDNKSMCDPGKISYRKDKFTQHFANTHPEVNCASYYDNNHFVVTSRFARRCGFCTTYWFGNWQDRINHIGDHFSVDRYDMTQWQVLDNEEEDEEGDEVDDEEDDDDRGPDEDDKGFDEDQYDRADGPGKDFDWHDHDYNDDALSDFSEDDSDDSPPCPVPKQLAQTEHHDALETSNPEESLFGNQNDIFANQTRRTIFDGASSEEAMFVD